ncbi:MAG TPA: hypothetical protein VFW21_05395 [Mycobacterium sp.]|nr:hypothetical protein [Mycobacterium sp.]
MRDPMSSVTDIIKYGIAERVRSLGGESDDIDSIAVAAAYAVLCWNATETRLV